MFSFSFSKNTFSFSLGVTEQVTPNKHRLTRTSSALSHFSGCVQAYPQINSQITVDAHTCSHSCKSKMKDSSHVAWCAGKGWTKHHKASNLELRLGGGKVKRFNFPFNEATRGTNMLTLACEEHKESKTFPFVLKHWWWQWLPAQFHHLSLWATAEERKLQVGWLHVHYNPITFSCLCLRICNKYNLISWPFLPLQESL